jgi:hypothetical protein
MKPTTVNQDRNGVRVRVHRSDEGSTVDATCQCFGSEERSHSTMSCPLYKAQQSRGEQ